MKTYIKEILAKRKALSKGEYNEFSDKICHKVLSLEEYVNADKNLFYYPYNNEADILPLVKKAFDDKKNVYFPFVTGDTTMKFVKVKSLDDFREGYKGIYEPVGEEVFDNTSENACALIPGSSFDKQGNRTGYGKGYYDRYLDSCKGHICKVGICFFLQILEEIPDKKSTDIPMDYVINEKEIIRSK